VPETPGRVVILVALGLPERAILFCFQLLSVHEADLLAARHRHVPGFGRSD